MFFTAVICKAGHQILQTEMKRWPCLQSSRLYVLTVQRHHLHFTMWHQCACVQSGLGTKTTVKISFNLKIPGSVSTGTTGSVLTTCYKCPNTAAHVPTAQQKYIFYFHKPSRKISRRLVEYIYSDSTDPVVKRPDVLLNILCSVTTNTAAHVPTSQQKYLF